MLNYTMISGWNTVVSCVSAGKIVLNVGTLVRWDGFRLKINYLPYARFSRETVWHLFLLYGFDGGGCLLLTSCYAVVMLVFC